MFIYDIYIYIYIYIGNIGIPKHEKHLWLLSSGTKLFINIELKGFRHKERDPIFLHWLFHLPQTTWGTRHKASASKRKSTVFFRPQNSTHWLYSKISAHAFSAWRHSHPWSHPLSGIFIVTSLNDTSAPRAREHLRPCLHLSNPCAKRKVLSLTKPKGKIYKAKSLGHYITWASKNWLTGRIRFWEAIKIMLTIKCFIKHKFFIYNHHQRPGTPSARISLTLSPHSSQSSFASSWSSRLHPVSAQSC